MNAMKLSTSMQRYQAFSPPALRLFSNLIRPTTAYFTPNQRTFRSFSTAKKQPTRTFNNRWSYVPIVLFAGLTLFGVGYCTMSSSSYSSERDRMRERFKIHGVQEKQMGLDGNCQMHALSDQLYSDPGYYKEVRKEIVNWLRLNGDSFVDKERTAKFKDFLDLDQYSSWSQYCNIMSRNGIWGDHFTLIAAAEVYKVKIWILSSVESPNNQGYITVIEPLTGTATKEIKLSHWHERHYNSLYKTKK
eukprot:TRINITY_DN3111_c0_g2_i1.p1 TRINITY_DN3111_c0_g2~~TRINITY_DN3111_c0_g2_i1.p1  ORF type:complete len:246 (-),score=22.46 TRINITY_DN3111_c0_g2_i1:75-812(-)